MELQRKDYPALLESLPPAQAVNLLNDRMRHVTQLNSHIADWLQERRRVEELYVQGLRKLANKRPPDESSDLGVFSTPWQKIVSATEAIAESHHQLAQKIEADVERPLRDFSATNRDVQAMTTISGNLQAMSKEIDTAKKKSDKLRDKGAKAAANKVAGAVAEVESATIQWESQAPYVFEKLQAVDESRLNHLRDALTQFQTHEVDQVERNRITAEETLNVLLNIETADEIKTFVLRMQNGERNHQPPARKPSNTGNTTTPSRNLAPPPTPPTPGDDNRSQKSGSAHEGKHGGLASLKRFGTVLGRRRQSTHPYGRASSPERKASSNNLGAAFSGFGKGKSKDRDQAGSSLDRPTSPARPLSTPRPSDASGSPQQMRQMIISDRPNGTSSPEPPVEPTAGPSNVNGSVQETIPELNEPLSPPPPADLNPDPEKDAEGFSVPPSALDAITEAEREAGLVSNENAPAPQFKLDIRNAPIQEEDGDADAALANMANTLRAQAAPTARRSNTLRGRRDVRNTIFVPNPATPELTTLGDSPVPPLPSGGSESTSFSTPIPPPQPASPAFKMPHRTLLSDDHAASDTQSVRSGRSLSSSASTTIRHPDLHEPGLNASLVETVSAWFEQGNVTKAMVIGQVALAFNPVDLSAGPFGTESIRLDNFPVLEKVAPNPAFIEQSSENPGNYTVDLSKITKTSVAFHYQVHLDSSNLSSFAPLVLAPAWRPEAMQTSVLLHYSLNPNYNLGDAGSITLRNLILVLRLEPGSKAKSCQSKPPGTFSRDKGLIYWRLGDVTLVKDQPAQTMRVRFLTEGEAKPGNSEARWEVTGDQSLSFGSGLGVSQVAPSETKLEGEADPFADADENAPPPSPAIVWKPVASIKRISSGTYLGV
ncbi:Muniscin C-terminal mu homology domain-containing protein [Dendryphion nanum]|uniref:Muniscin C-terminal mu homology domain-containing protein n=1 Tax=Dendryphion nanum TaxID=256645 RepID=A0A9P9DGC5_9PLEO|nr:Muniscin C-terminal mu homology domain-containing protein [Dendryphion nanum]